MRSGPGDRILALVLGFAVTATCGAGCSRRAPPEGGTTTPSASVPATAGSGITASSVQHNHLADAGRDLRLAMEERTWVFPATPLGELHVVVVLPDRMPDEKFPLLIALHGRGEAMKGSAIGARGWVDDYALTRAMRRLREPPLRSEDFEGFVEPQRLALFNRTLAQAPYRGLVVLCPYTADILAGDRPFARVRPYTRFLVETLLPRARRELPVEGTPETTGIDGVSLGGRVGILSGLAEPSAFRTVAGLQAAFDSEDAPRLADLAAEARRKNPGLVFRFLTSDDDFFRDANRAISRALTQRGLSHQLLIVPGPHDYSFNRGPGALEMLVFHDRVLRGLPGL